MKVIESIRKSKKNLTLIMIAHNLKTLEKCDRIIKFKSGRIDFDGPTDNIFKNLK